MVAHYASSVPVISIARASLALLDLSRNPTVTNMDSHLRRKNPDTKVVSAWARMVSSMMSMLNILTGLQSHAVVIQRAPAQMYFTLFDRCVPDLRKTLETLCRKNPFLPPARIQKPLQNCSHVAVGPDDPDPIRKYSAAGSRWMRCQICQFRWKWSEGSNLWEECPDSSKSQRSCSSVQSNPKAPPPHRPGNVLGRRTRVRAEASTSQQENLVETYDISFPDDNQ